MTASMSQRVERGLLFMLVAQPLFFIVSPAFEALAQDAPRARDINRGFELRAGVLHSDNVLRTPAGDVDGTIYSTGFGLDVEREGRRLDLVATGDLDWMKYPDNTFDTDVTGFFDGTATFDIVPELFEWSAQDTYGQQVTNAFASTTPDTVEGVNYFTTGPRITARLGGNLSLALSGNYSNTNHEDSNLDNDRYGGGVALARELSATSALSLNATTQRISFDAVALDADYDQQEFFLAYNGSARRDSLRVELGYSVLDRQSEQSSGVLARLEVERRISAASRLGVYLSRQFSDAGDIFRSRLDQSGASAPLALAVADPFEDRTVGFLWSWEMGRTRCEFGASRSEERYERAATADNRTLSRFNVNLRRRLGPRLTLSLEGHTQREDFDTVDFEAKDVGASVALERTFGRTLGAALQYNWHDRTSSSVAAEYSEGRIGLSLFFRPARR